MHIEKNVCDNVVGMLLNLVGKSKDNLKARLDLKEMGIREELHPVEKISRNGTIKYELPPALYTMTKDEKRTLCKTLYDIKVPNGYSSNISRCVNLQQAKLLGLKSHDCHILMQQLLPIALRGLLSKVVSAVLFDLCGYFRDICSKTLDVEELKRHEAHIPIIMCHLEMIFPPSFFTIMAHLVLHLATQARIAGLVIYRWMYYIKRYLGSLKSHVRNKAHPDASIAEAISALECVNFCSWYVDGFDMIFNVLSSTSNDTSVVDTSNIMEVFTVFHKRESL